MCWLLLIGRLVLICIEPLHSITFHEQLFEQLELARVCEFYIIKEGTTRFAEMKFVMITHLALRAKFLTWS